MAQEDEMLSLPNTEDFTLDELLDAFNELYVKYKSFKKKQKVESKHGRFN